LPRKKRTDIKVNNNDSLEGLMQETYNDACLQINDAQRSINLLSNTIVPTDVDDITKIAKETGNMMKIKDSAIKIKLELAKLQSDIIKNRGDVDTTISERSNGSASLGDFKSIRDMIKKNFVDELDNENENEN
jgi:hypothetical protein